VVITVIEHQPSCPLDRFTGWLTQAPAAPVTLHVVHAGDGEPIPDVAGCGSGLIVLGGEQDAYADEAWPWLPPTRRLLADAVTAGLPTLGICLGAQLLAVAAGGRVVVGAPAGREGGVVDLTPRPGAADDRLAAALMAAAPRDVAGHDGRLPGMPSMHADAIAELPPGAVWLASTERYPHQAFRVGGRAWGVQFHPEVSTETFDAWAREDLDASGAARASAELRDRWDEVSAGGRALAERFVEVAADAAR
jgi:GMP synthase (glutamine-hydrolysing)